MANLIMKEAQKQNGVRIQYSTLDEFTNSLVTESSAKKFWKRTEDFFPYQKSEEVWSGFYTSRPGFKKTVRDFSSEFHSKSLIYSMQAFRLNDETYLQSQRALMSTLSVM